MKIGWTCFKEIAELSGENWRSPQGIEEEEEKVWSYSMVWS